MIELEFSRPIAVSRLSQVEKIFDISANDIECRALAERFDILAVERLEAQITLSLIAGGKVVQLTGTFSADVVQSCVVTLEPVSAQLADSFALTFAEEAPIEEGEIDIGVDGEDPAEPLQGGIVDIGEATAEHLALALDPFPRKPGAVFDSPPAQEIEETDVKTNPFDVLSRLKDG